MPPIRLAPSIFASRHSCVALMMCTNRIGRSPTNQHHKHFSDQEADFAKYAMCLRVILLLSYRWKEKQCNVRYHKDGQMKWFGQPSTCLVHGISLSGHCTRNLSRLNALTTQLLLWSRSKPSMIRSWNMRENCEPCGENHPGSYEPPKRRRKGNRFFRHGKECRR